MSVTIRIAEFDEASARLDALVDDRARGRLAQRIARGLDAAALEVIGHAQKKRFTGKGPFPVDQHKLGVRSGRLRRSIRHTRPQVDDRAGSVELSMGSNVKYFSRHEFGHEGREQVRGHTRRNFAGKVAVGGASRGRLTKSSISALKSARQAGRRGYSQVRPHTRKVNTRARRPLGTAIEEVGGEIFRGRILRETRHFYEEGGRS